MLASIPQIKFARISISQIFLFIFICYNRQVGHTGWQCDIIPQLIYSEHYKSICSLIISKAA